MPFSKEDKALTKNLSSSKKIQFTGDSDGISELQKGRSGHYTKQEI